MAGSEYSGWLPASSRTLESLSGLAVVCPGSVLDGLLPAGSVVLVELGSVWLRVSI